jgi:hypothetical protein
MFFLIFWTMYVPFGMVIASLVANWLMTSLRRVGAEAWRRTVRAQADCQQAWSDRFSALTEGSADRPWA